MEFSVLKKKEQHADKWSAGKTTELGIYPKNAKYPDDFAWRLSTATCKRNSAKFSDLPGYNRVLFNLSENEATLTHTPKDADPADGAGEKVTLGELEMDEFSGGDKTVAEGLEKDYNLIIREDLKYTAGVIDQIQAGAGVNQDKSVPVGDNGEAKFLSIDSIIKGKRFPVELKSDENFGRVTQAVYCVDGFSSIHMEVTDMSLVTNVEDAPVDIKIIRLTEGEQLIASYGAKEKIKMTVKGAGRLIHLQLFHD